MDTVAILHPSQRQVLVNHKDYDLRNDAAHNDKSIPKEAKDISAWLEGLEELVNRF